MDETARNVGAGQLRFIHAGNRGDQLLAAKVYLSTITYAHRVLQKGLCTRFQAVSPLCSFLLFFGECNLNRLSSHGKSKRKQFRFKMVMEPIFMRNRLHFRFI